MISGSASSIIDNVSKISPELKDFDSDKKTTVYVWFKDSIDMTQINEKAEKIVGFTQETLEKEEKELCEFHGEVYINNNFTEEYITFLKETKERRHIILEKQNVLIQKQRDLTKEYYSQYNDEMLILTGISEKQVIYKSLCSPVIIIVAGNNEIKKLSENENVEYIGYKDNNEPKEDFSSSPQAVDSVRYAFAWR